MKKSASVAVSQNLSKRSLLAVFDKETVDADHRLHGGLADILVVSG